MMSELNLPLLLIPLATGLIIILTFRKSLKKYFLKRKSIIEKNLEKIKENERQQTGASDSNTRYFGKSIELFDKKTNLFVIIASICTIISLAPLFLTSLLGENWFGKILAIPLGFDALMLIIAATFFGATFSLLILIVIAFDFCNCIFKDQDIPVYQKTSTLIVNLIGGVSILCLNLFLVFVWFSKFDYIIFNFAFPIFMVIYIILFLIVSIGILGYFHEKTTNPSEKTIFLILSIIVIIALIASFIPIVNYVGVFYNEKSKYYSPKTINSSINYSTSEKIQNYPIILSITPDLSELKPTKNISDFDVYYAQCQWSTNYGFFFTTSYNNSVIKSRSQEFIIPRCIDFHEKIYWTYEDIDYTKEKPPVYIGLILEDPNKKDNYHLSDALRIFNWTDTNSLENVESTSWAQRIPQR